MRTTWRVMAPETGSVAFVGLQTCVIAFLLALFAPSAESFAASSGVSGADRAPSLGKQRSARARERALARSRAPKFRKG